MTGRSSAPAPRNRWWHGPLLSLVTLLVLLALLEAAIRLWLPDGVQTQLPHVGVDEDTQMQAVWQRWQRDRRYGTTTYPSSFDVLDPQLGWRVKPDVSARHAKPGAYDVAVTTNAFGLRGGDPRTLRKPAGVVRVGVFGDSQTFGETVNDDQTYVEQLRRRLPGNEFLNFGVRGYGTDQMLLAYQARAGRFDLDVVLLGFAFFHMERNAREFMFYAKPSFELSADGALTLHGVPVPERETLLAQDLGDRLRPWLDRSVLARWTWQRLRNLQYRTLYAEDGEVWRLTAALVTRFVGQARADGAEVVVLSIDETRPALEPALAGVVERAGARLLDLGPVLRQAGADGLDYLLPNDNHWTATGNALVGAAVAHYLCDRQLVHCGPGPDRDRRGDGAAGSAAQDEER